MKRIGIVVAVSIVGLPSLAADLTAQELVALLDKNMVFETRTTDATMRVTKEGKTSQKKLHLQSRGYDTSFVDFLDPPRDKGTRYLKLEKNLWMYLPGAEKQVKISGHMLRQSLMGSDFSYEDMLESPDMAGRYDPTIVGEEPIDGRPCIVLLLKAKVPEVTYPQRKVWIDKEHYVPIKAELYALTGKVMKEQRIFDVKPYPVGDGKTRYYPSRFQMKNLLQQDTMTELLLEDPKFDAPIPDDVFSLSNLGRGN